MADEVLDQQPEPDTRSMWERMEEYTETHMLEPGVPSADGTTFAIKPEVLAAAKQEAEAKAKPAEPVQAVPDPALAELGIEQPADWGTKTAEDRYKHLQSFTSKKANEAKALKDEVEKFSPYKQWMDQLTPHAQYIQQALLEYYQRHTGQQQGSDPEADPSNMSAGDLKAWMTGEIDRRSRQIAQEILNSDTRIKLLQEGIELNKTRSANPDYDAYAEEIQLLKQKYPSLPTGEALRIVKDLAEVGKAKKSNSGEASLADSPAKSQSPTTTEGQRLNREDLEKTAASLPSNPGVSPSASRPVRPAQTLDQKMKEFTVELLQQQARQS